MCLLKNIEKSIPELLAKNPSYLGLCCKKEKKKQMSDDVELALLKASLMI